MQMQAEGLDGFVIPRADAHQGEYVAPHDERLSWLTGFTGSAGFCCALAEIAGVFIDGRYRTQVKQQVDLGAFTPVPWPDVTLPDWLREHSRAGAIVGFDPWLLTQGQLASYEAALEGSGITLRAAPNLVDRIWDDQPAPPMSRAEAYPTEFSGKSSRDKLAEAAADLKAAGEDAAVITLPDSLCWLLNIRGQDVSRTPLLHGFAIMQATGRLQLFIAPEKVAHLGPDPLIDAAAPADFLPALSALTGRVRCDKTTVPVAVIEALGSGSGGTQIVYGDELCALSKACKNPVEIAGTRQAHLTDGAAMCELLCWLDAQPAGTVTEIDVVTQLEGCRRATNALQDISFDAICGAGPNGAIMHYRVTHETNRTLADGDLLVLDSGGQYLNGTTDITRTISIGAPGADERAAFTRVLKGMIAISVLKPGMILSNEPGYYREGAFGIRIENLIVVTPCGPLPGADPERSFLEFETLTYVPIDRRLIVLEDLAPQERDWIDSYHAACRTALMPRLGAPAQDWLERVTQPL